MRVLRPFISDNASKVWATSLGLLPGYAYATDNIVIARYPVQQSGTLLIPMWALDFVLARTEGLEAWAHHDHTFWFRWANGAWLKSVGVHGEFPERAGVNIDQAAPEGEELTCPITSDWREVYRRVSELTVMDGIGFTRTAIIGGTGEGCSFDEELDTPLPEEVEKIYFATEYLAKALASSSEWGPDCWPSPVPFRGPGGFAGVIASRRE
jgi:hypothetical protein